MSGYEWGTARPLYLGSPATLGKWACAQPRWFIMQCGAWDDARAGAYLGTGGYWRCMEWGQ